MAYNPQEGSVAWKAIQYFTTNPDEQLTSSDIGAKFDKPATQIHSLLALAIDAGVLKRAPNADDEMVYSLGTGHPAVRASQAAAPSLRAMPDLPAQPNVPRAGTKRVFAAAAIDLDKVEFDNDVPLPRGRGITGDWDKLLERMQVNQSCALPKTARTAVTRASTKAKREGSREYSLRIVNDTQIRVWRVK